jgi:hypothetical protein
MFICLKIFWILKSRSSYEVCFSRSASQAMKDERKSLAEALRVLCKANIHSLDRRSQWLHESKQQSVAQEKGQNHTLHKDIVGGFR